MSDSKMWPLANNCSLFVHAFYLIFLCSQISFWTECHTPLLYVRVLAFVILLFSLFWWPVWRCLFQIFLLLLLLKCTFWAGEMTQGANVLSFKTHDQHLLSRTHRIEGKNWLPQVIFWPPHKNHMCMRAHTCWINPGNFFKRTKVPPLKCLYFFHYKTRTKKWQVKFINILFCYKHLCSPLKVFSIKVRGKKRWGPTAHSRYICMVSHQVHTTNMTHYCYCWPWWPIRHAPPVWLAKVDVGLGCLAKKMLSWSLHSRITCSPFPYCGV